LFLTLDSDDTCVPAALARFKHYWDSIPDEQRTKFSAVTGLCVDEQGKLVGKRFPQDVLDSDSLEVRYRYKVTGEKWGFQRTEVLKQFPFPVGPGVSFVPEGVVWGAIARRYKTRYVNEGLRVYRNNYQGNNQQLTRSPIRPSGAAGMAFWHAGVLNEEIDWFWYDPSFFLRSAVHYVRFSLHARLGANGLGSKVNSLISLMLVGMAWPVGWAVFCLDLRRLRAKHA